MEIRVDFYKQTGKWYSGGNVKIGDARLWRGNLPQAVVDNQEILTDGWQGKYFVVTSDLPEHDHDPNYMEFSMALYKPEVFANIRRRK